MAQDRERATAEALDASRALNMWWRGLGGLARVSLTPKQAFLDGYATGRAVAEESE